jgi:small subunit ribosomal protein S20
MAHTRTAKKRVRQIETHTARNRARRSRVRSYLRKVEQAIASGDKAVAETAYREAMPELHRTAQKGAMHKNTVARALSGLSRRINAM